MNDIVEKSINKALRPLTKQLDVPGIGGFHVLQKDIRQARKAIKTALEDSVATRMPFGKQFCSASVGNFYAVCRAVNFPEKGPHIELYRCVSKVVPKG